MSATQHAQGRRAHVARHVRSFPVDGVAAPRPVRQAGRVGDGRRHTRNHASADNLHHPDVRRPGRSDFNRRTSTHKALPPIPGASTGAPGVSIPSRYARARAASTPSWPLGLDSGSAGSRPVFRENTHVHSHPRRKSSLATPSPSAARPPIDRHDFASSTRHERQAPLIVATSPPAATSLVTSSVAITTAAPSTISITPTPTTATTAITSLQPTSTTITTTAPSSAVTASPPASLTKYASGRNAGHKQTPSFQTRYMHMLLALDKIPRLHNILASVFTWTLLAGFVVFPGAFTSPAAPPATAPSLLPLAVALTSLGALGLAWLGVRWRRNYVWLLNRVYMPGALSGFVGGLATVTSVYAHAAGFWSPPAMAAAAVEAALCLLCGALFIVYNNLLLGRVKRDHDSSGGEKLHGRGSASDEAEGKGEARPQRRGFITRMWRFSQSPPFAPGSIV
ncbi:hypothetical protein RB595_001470 [Gaeumannomyces hyphopodioides]